jgi:hypothetical protein
MSPQLADCVAKRFCASERARLIQDQAPMRNVDSKIHSPRFVRCGFLFYSFSAVTFATQSAQLERAIAARLRRLLGEDRKTSARSELFRL